VTTDAGNASVEVQFTARPTNRTVVAASVANTSARLGPPSAGARIGNEGDRLQNSPELQGTVSAEYGLPVLNGDSETTLRADTSYYGWQISNQTVANYPFFMCSHMPWSTPG
jgi:hypothetical protein